MSRRSYFSRGWFDANVAPLRLLAPTPRRAHRPLVVRRAPGASGKRTRWSLQLHARRATA